VLSGGMLGPLLLMLGLVRTEAAAGSLLLSLEGLFTMPIAWLVFRENVDRRLLLGALAILAGAALLSWGGRGVGLDSGPVLIAGACLACGVDNNLTRKLSSTDPVLIAMIKGLAAGVANSGSQRPPAWPCLSRGSSSRRRQLGSSALASASCCSCWRCATSGRPARAPIFSPDPFIAAVLAIGLSHEAATPSLILAGLLMGFGLWMHLAERHDHEHEHEMLEHEHCHIHDPHHHHGHDGLVTEPHSHWHRYQPLRHRHPHYPDLHHRHRHG
jgi:hypothetical protein